MAYMPNYWANSASICGSRMPAPVEGLSVDRTIFVWHLLDSHVCVMDSIRRIETKPLRLRGGHAPNAQCTFAGVVLRSPRMPDDEAGSMARRSDTRLVQEARH